MCTWIFILGLLQGESKLTQSLSRFRFDLFIRIHHRGLTMSGCPAVNWMFWLVREFRWWQLNSSLQTSSSALMISNDLIHWSSLPESTSLTSNVLWDRESENSWSYHLSPWVKLCLKPLLFLDFSIYFFFFLAHYVVCGILVPKPENEARPRQWKQWVLTAGPPGKSLDFPIFWANKFLLG